MKNILLGVTIFSAAFAAGQILSLSSRMALPFGSEINTSSEARSAVVPTEAVSVTRTATNEFENIVAEYDPERSTTAKKRSEVKLLWESSFHSEFFLNKSGEKWLGLFKTGEKYVLRPTKLKVEKIKEPDLYDIETSTSDKERSVFLVRDILPFSKAVVPTVFENVVDEDTQLDATVSPTVRTLECNGTTYSLFVENPTGGEYPEKGSKLVLEANGTKQILRYLKKGCNDCFWTLHWAGDLDLDGKLDLYMDLTDHYNVQDLVLFLSSKAENGKLLKHVADFYNVGC